MQEKGVINTNQFIWMLFIMIASLPNLLAPEFLIMIAGRDAWLSVIGGWGMDILMAFVYAYMGIRFTGQNFVQYSISILGKFLGRLVGTLFPLYFLMVSTILISGLSHLLKAMFLPKTPFEAIFISTILLSGYAARKGIEVNGRVAEVLGPIYLLSVIILSFLLIPNMDIDRIKPQFDQGVYPFLIGSPFMLSFFAICIIMGMFIPQCNRPENGFLAKVTAVSMGAYLIGSIVILSIISLGFEQAENLLSPGLVVSKLINIGHILERVEIFGMIIAVGSGIMSCALMVWAFSLGMAQIAGLSTYKSLVYPGILISTVISFTWFNNSIELANFVHYIFPIPTLFVTVGVEIFLLILALVLRKRGQT